MNRFLADMPRKYFIGGAGLAVAAIVLVAVLISHRTPPAAVASGPSPALTVTASVPSSAVWPVILEVSGAVAPWQEAIISAQIGGYQLNEILVNVGDQVKKGQVLARINQALLRADEAVLLANFDQAEANYKRAVALKTNGFMSEQNILQLETQLKTTRALLESKRLQLRYTDVVAPDDGAVSARTATLGNVVATGQELFRLVRQNRLEWRGELSAKQLTLVAPGQPVRLALPSGAIVTATVRQAAPTLNTDSRLAFVYADIAPNSDVRAGMYATGKISIGQRPAMVVPADAVVLRDGRSYVVALADDGSTAMPQTAKVILKAVDVGRREAAEVEILSGLSEGTRIAVRGSGFLNDGDIVRIAESNPRPSPKGSPP